MARCKRFPCVLCWFLFWESISQLVGVAQVITCFVLSMETSLGETRWETPLPDITSLVGLRKQALTFSDTPLPENTWLTVEAMPLHCNGCWDILPWKWRSTTVPFMIQTWQTIMITSLPWQKWSNQKRGLKEDRSKKEASSLQVTCFFLSTF